MNKLFSRIIISAFLISVLLSISSCSKNSDVIAEKIIITGYQLSDINGQPAGTVGTPNTNTKGTQTEISIFPVPAVNTIYLSITARAASTAKVTIKTADYIPTGMLGSNLGIKGMVSQVVYEQAVELQSGRMGLTINLSDMATGYYRLYLKTEDEILHDNFVIETK